LQQWNGICIGVKRRRLTKREGIAVADFFTINASIVGYRDVMKALGKYDLSARRLITSSMRKAVQPVISEARKSVPSPTPMRGWRLTPPVSPQAGVRGGQGWPAWITGEIRNGIKISFRPSKQKKNFSRTVVAVKNMSASGAIYEFARKSDKHKTFISHLDNSQPGGRLVWKAFDKHAPMIRREINTAINTANARLQSAVFNANDRSR
jgi:hypothetical protein